MKRFTELLGSLRERFSAASDWLSKRGTVQKVVLLIILLSACAFAFRFAEYAAAPAANAVAGIRTDLQEAFLGNPVVTLLVITALSVTMHLLYRLLTKLFQATESPWKQLFSARFAVEHGSKRELVLNLIAATAAITLVLVVTWAAVGIVELALNGVAAGCETIAEADWPIVVVFLLIAGSYLFVAFRPQQTEATESTTEAASPQPTSGSPDGTQAATIPPTGSGS